MEGPGRGVCEFFERERGREGGREGGWMPKGECTNGLERKGKSNIE